MKKVLLLSVCLIVSCLLGGGKSWAGVTFAENGTTLTINVSGTATDDDASSVSTKMSNSNYTKVVVVGGTINDKLAQSIFFTQYAGNDKITSLDFSGTSYEQTTFAKSFFTPSESEYRKGQLKVTALSLPGNITKIADEALNGVGSLAEVVFPNGLTEIGKQAFAQTSITKMTLPANVEKICDEAFKDMKSLTEIVLSDNLKEIGKQAFNNTKVSKLVFPANVEKIGDEAFKDMSSLTEIVLPENLTYIGKKAFVGTNLTSITFPANLDKIDDAAFANVKVTGLKFNSKLRYIGNSAFSFSSAITEESLIIPASVKYIGPSAFNFRQYQDVYFLGDRAPVMPYGTSVINDSQTGVTNTAFSSHTLNGNKGFDANGGGNNHDNANTGWANRENYNNGAYFCILHYPKTLTNNDDIDTYVDVTRKYMTSTSSPFAYAEDYKVGKETEALKVGDDEAKSWNPNHGIGWVEYGYKDTYLGEQYIWPSQNQWMRAYITATNGVRWDGVTKYRPTLLDWETEVLAEAGYTTEKYTEDELSKMAHQGTRMFVLANNDAHGEKYDSGIKKDGTWWTICVPFNMTKKQVLDTFGDKTQLCLFRSVTRQIEVNGKNHILIRFDIDPMKYKTADADGKKLKYDGTDGTHAAGEWKYNEIASDDVVSDNVGDDDIAIWAHESYMIKPSDGENSDKDPVTIANYEPVPGNPLPSVVRAETVYKTQDEPTYDNLYRFVGNYESGMTMPQYSYFYGTTKNDKTEKFRFNTGTTTVWKANKSLIQASAHDGGFQDFQNFFGGSAESAAKVKQTTVFGGIDDPNGDTTAIDDVQIVVGNDTLTPIFSLDGKMVSVNGDTTGLAKGIYVKAGKKFIVE